MAVEVTCCGRYGERVLVAPVVHKPECFHLRRREILGHVNRHFAKAEILRGQQARVAADDAVVFMNTIGTRKPNSLIDAATLSIALEGIFRLLRA